MVTTGAYTSQDGISHQTPPDVVVGVAFPETVELHDLSLRSSIGNRSTTCVDITARILSTLSVMIMLMPTMWTSTVLPGTFKIFWVHSKTVLVRR
jgi:hypothetical protein